MHFDLGESQGLRFSHWSPPPDRWALTAYSDAIAAITKANGPAPVVNIGHRGDAPEDQRELWGVFHGIAQAKAELRVNGVMDE